MPETIENPNTDQLKMAYQKINNEINALTRKMGTFEQEVKEHELVLTAMEAVEDTRKCARMVGGCLAERTVGEIRPSVKENIKKIQAAMEMIAKQLAEKLDARRAFMKKYNIQTAPEVAKQEVVEAGAGSRGVLV